MASVDRSKRKLPPLEERFTFLGDAVARGDQAALRSALFEVEDRATGAERSLKLWRKTGTPVDEDLRQLWLHEMRQVQRVMSYAGAREVIVDVLEFIEDAEHFGVVLERVGQPLSSKRLRVSRQHWLRNLGAPRSRALLWRNIRRLATALGIVHAQGLVHGRLNAEAVLTEGAEEPDFQLGGFEWSLWLGAATSDRVHANIGPHGAAQRAETYSFAEDWHSLGKLAADCLDVVVTESGEVEPATQTDAPIFLSVSERVFLKRLIAPARLDLLEADSITRAIDDIVVGVGRLGSARAGTFVLFLDSRSGLGDAVYTASDGEIAVDGFRQQLDWVRADLDGGVTLLVPREFDPATGGLQLVTDTMVYGLRAFRDEGSAVWDIAVCSKVQPRRDALSLRDQEEHTVAQPISVAGHSREAQELRARLGPDALDWSAFANRRTEGLGRADVVRRALLVVQIVEAVVKALEIYPVQVLGTEQNDGRRYATVRAEPDNERDRLARRIGLASTAVALHRLFEEEHRDAEAKWRISQSPSLGSNRSRDVLASFIDVVEHTGSRAYRFEVDDELAEDGPLFLRTDQDIGTEEVISRRLRNIKALDTRVDLAEMLDDPWRMRRSSREVLKENDAAFKDLDEPKQKALQGLWSTLPSFFVVGPPGVGKTKLAEETVRRRFAMDRSTRMLLSAQGHDALDNLQEKIREILTVSGLEDVIVVRSTTSDRRPTSDAEVHRASLDYLERLSESALVRDAPLAIRERVHALRDAAGRVETAKDTIDREQRAGLRAFSSLVLDAANIVISTANSPDIGRLVEAREQFDWVIVEEAAKATGPELIGPLMLSGRRLLIGDHYQLPPFEADRLVKVLRDHSLVEQSLTLARQLVRPLLREGELDEIDNIGRDPAALKDTADLALRLLEPFRTFAEEDERRSRGNPSHRAIAATLTEQRRMDPAIAEVVSEAFYGKKLKTEAGRVRAAETESPPFEWTEPLPTSPVVVIEFEHVSSTGQSRPIERGRPRWHNPSEVEAVIDVLRHVRARNGKKRPTLAILSPYKAQVDRLHDRIASLRARDLAHLDAFAPVREGRGFVGTVDSFQGSEADLVVVSLVRNNPRTGGSALGFLRDRRRMNVLLSRAKWQLILVGSLKFLRESVRGINPDAETHDLSFLTRMVDTIDVLTGRTRGNGVPLATIIRPEMLKGRV